MGVEFRLTSETPAGRPDVAVLHLGGWLDAQSENQLVAAVTQAREQGAKYVLLDLADVVTITSAGIRGIQQSFAVLTPKGATMIGALKLCNAAPQIRAVLSITGILISVPVYESQDIAVDSFGK
jgi:anti-anti-sigma factor